MYVKKIVQGSVKKQTCIYKSMDKKKTTRFGGNFSTCWLYQGASRGMGTLLEIRAIPKLGGGGTPGNLSIGISAVFQLEGSEKVESFEGLRLWGFL